MRVQEVLGAGEAGKQEKEKAVRTLLI